MELTTHLHLAREVKNERSNTSTPSAFLHNLDSELRRLTLPKLSYAVQYTELPSSLYRQFTIRVGRDPGFGNPRTMY